MASRNDFDITLTIESDPGCSSAEFFNVWFDNVQQTGTYSSGDVITVDNCGRFAVKVQYAEPGSGTPIGEFGVGTVGKCRLSQQV